MTEWHDWLVVIPARYESTRLPGKPLADLKGKPLIVRVFERVSSLQKLGAEILVATDHDDVASACQKHGVGWKMTKASHQSGTDRCAEVASYVDRKFVMNIQGDEPFIDLADLENLRKGLANNPDAAMASLMYENKSEEDFKNPNCVKVITGADGQAIYFSRSSIPFHRDDGFVCFKHHIGVYAFTKKDLEKFCALPPSLLEQREKLEQLRAIENGMQIRMVLAEKPSIGIDTPKDLEDAREIFQ